jgi:hypothetical protein
MGSRVMGAGESNGVRDYKRLGEIAKLATTYVLTTWHKGCTVEHTPKTTMRLLW